MTIQDNWHSLRTDIKEPAICYSVGYLVGDHEKVKILYSSISPEDEFSGEVGKGNMIIPTEMIIKIVTLSN